jgi:hypothetical protein
MSTRCQIEFRTGDVRRTVYRNWDCYPSAVIPDLLAFLAWSTRKGDVEYLHGVDHLEANTFLDRHR